MRAWVARFVGCAIFLVTLGVVVCVPQNKGSAPLGKPMLTKDPTTRLYQPYSKKEHWAFYVQFDKRKYRSTGLGCAVGKPQGVNGGLLQCTITAPPELKGYITHIEYRCEAGDPVICGYVHECPAGGTCQDHDYAYEPHDWYLKKTRSLDWFGWTNDGNSAMLRFDVFMSEEEKPPASK
jgi:hypothetical protein